MFNSQRLTQVLPPDKSTVPQGNRSRLQGRAAMWVAASAICVSYILSTLPTPLYVIYRQTFQFSQIMLTVIYAVYDIGADVAVFVDTNGDGTADQAIILTGVADLTTISSTNFI